VLESLEHRRLLAADNPLAEPQSTPDHGLTATYYDNLDFTGPSITRIDPTIDFNWGWGSPDPAIGGDTFSARWTGQLIAPQTGQYTFHLTADDGIRLWIGGDLLIDHWNDSPGQTRTATTTLQANQAYDLRLEYYENKVGARIRLEWTTPSESQQVIPREYFSPVLAEQTHKQLSAQPPTGLLSISSSTTDSGTAFRVFDATAYRGRPDLSQFGLERIYVAGNEFFAGTWPNYDKRRADEAATRALANKVADRGEILVINIEHWPTDIRTASEAEVRETIDKFIELIQWLKDERPELEVGIYSMLPVRDYWTPVYHATRDPQRVHQWEEANRRLQELAEKVDYIFPSLYTFYDDPEGWAIYAEANIREAQKYGKPVIPFVWMQYHQSNPKLDGQYIDRGFWRMQLETTRGLADGVVIWGGWQLPWDDQAEWWDETLRFQLTLLESQ